MTLTLMLACTADPSDSAGGDALEQVVQTVTAAEGGTLTAQGMTLDIPAGALTEDVEITMSVYETLDVPEADGGWGDFVVLEPHGLEFAMPVRLTMPAPDPLPVEPLSEVVRPGQGISWLNDDAAAWEPQLGRTDAGASVVRLEHFSTYGWLNDNSFIHMQTCGPDVLVEEDWEAACALLQGTFDRFGAWEDEACPGELSLNAICYSELPYETQPFEEVEQLLERALDPRSDCEIVAETFNLAAPTHATLETGECVEAEHFDSVEEFHAWLGELDDAGDCSAEVSNEELPCSVVRQCVDGETTVTFGGLVLSNDDYSGTLLKEGEGQPCSYSVSTEEPPEPTWEGTELDDIGQYQKWAEIAPPETYITMYIMSNATGNLGEGYLFVDKHYDDKMGFGNDTTWAFNDQTGLFDFSYERPTNTSNQVPDFDFSCAYCEVGSEINDCADYGMSTLADGYPRGLICDMSKAKMDDGSPVFREDEGYSASEPYSTVLKFMLGAEYEG
jgi:hypothetical protein